MEDIVMQRPEETPIPEGEQSVSIPVDMEVPEAQQLLIDDVPKNVPEDDLKWSESLKSVTPEQPKQDGVVANPEEMAAAVTAATEGRISYQDAVRNLIMNPTPTTIREAAAATVARDIKEYKGMFDVAAAQGNLERAEMVARAIHAQNKEMTEFRANMKVAQEATMNMATASQATIANNSPEAIAAATKEHGINFAIRQMVDNKVAERTGGYSPTLKDVGLYIGGYVGAGLAGGKIGGAVGSVAGPMGRLVGTIAGAVAADAAYLYEVAGIVQPSIEKVTGIKSGGLTYTKQIGQLREYVASFPPEQQQLIINNIVDNIFDKTILPGDLGKFQGVIAAAKLFEEMDFVPGAGFQMPLKLQEALDVVGVGLGGIGAYSAVRRATSAAKTLSEVAGGAKVGEQVGATVTTGQKSTLGLSQVDEMALSLSFDASQFNKGIVGAAPEVQKKLEGMATSMMEALNTRLTVKADDAAVDAKEVLLRNSLPSDVRVASVDMENGIVLFQHQSGSTFISREVAEQAAETFRKQFGIEAEVVAANNKAVHASTDDILVGFHHTTKDFKKFKAGTEGAYGPGVYLYLNNYDSIQGALQSVGKSVKAVVTQKSKLIDVSKEMSEQSSFIKEVAARLNISQVDQLVDAGVDVLKNEGVVGIMNTKFNPRVGQPQVNVFVPDNAAIVNRRSYLVPEDVGLEAIEKARKGDTADLEGLKYKEESFRGAQEVSKHTNNALKEVLKSVDNIGTTMDRTTGVTTKVLDVIKRTSKDTVYSAIAGRLSTLSKQLGMDKIMWGRGGSEAMGGNTGLYTQGVDELLMSNKNLGNETLALHEITHSTTSTVLDAVVAGKGAELGLSDKQIKAAQSIITLSEDEKLAAALRKGVRGTPDEAKVDYMLSNQHEFLSHALTERGAIHDVLKNYMVEGVSVLNRIMEFISDILGLNKSSAFVKLNSDFLDIVDELKYAQRVDEADILSSMSSFGARPSLAHGFYIRGKFPTTTAVHTATDIESRWGVGLDPLHRASRESVEDRFITLLQEQKDRRAMSEFVKNGFDGLSAKQQQAVMGVLKQGEDAKQEFTVTELMARGLNKNEEHLAYFTARTASNVAWMLKNQEAMRSLRAQGFSQGVVTIGGSRVSTPMRRINNIADVEGKMAWDVRTSKLVRIEASKHGGDVIAESVRPMDVGGQQVTRIVGNANDISFGHLQPVVPYLPGSFRRIYTDDYFAKANVRVLRNGEMVDDSYHFKTARSGKDMDTYVKGMNNVLKEWRTNPANVTHTFIEKQVGRWENVQDVMTRLATGKFDDITSFSSHYNREAADYTNMFVKSSLDDLSQYTKSRGMKLTPIDDITRENTLNPLEAMQAEITNVARVRNIGEWREKYVDMWWNSFKDTLPPNIRNTDNPLAAMMELRPEMYSGVDNRIKFAESQRKYILSQLGVKTLDESFVEASIRRLTANIGLDSKLLGMPVGKYTVPMGAWMRSTDPLQFMRSLNFTVMLGMFNPAQLFVQANGAMTAIAISPIHGLKAAYAVPLLRIALMSDNPAVWDRLAKAHKLSSAGFSNMQEFVDTIKAIRKTGLIDGINSTSLHNLEEGKFNLFSPLTRKLQSTNTFFFDRGEEFTRLVAFDTARREWAAKNVGQAWNTDAALKEILVRTDDFTQNMSKANAAFYQRGVMSLPFQFLQYNLKLGTNVVGAIVKGDKGRGFTRSEAFRLMGAHVLAYGLVGNGLSSFYDEIVGGLESATGRKSTENERLAITQGAIAAVINGISEYFTDSPTRIATGTRLGAFDFYQRFASSLLNLDGAKLVDVLGGPTTGTMKRMGGIWDVAKIMYRDENITTEDIIQSINKVGSENISTWRNATKAYYAHNNFNTAMSGQGEPIAKLTNGEIAMQALGFTSASVDDYYKVRQNIKEHLSSIKELADTFDKTRIIYMRELATNGKSARTEDLAKFMSTLIPTNIGDRDLFYKSLKNGTAYPYADELTQTAAKYLTGMYNINDAHIVKDTGVQTRGPYAKEKQ